MSNENEFDKFISNKLYNYTSNVPDGLWNKIIVEKDRKKPIPFWKNGYLQAGIVAVIVAGLLGSYLYNKKPVSAEETRVNTTNNLNQVSAQKVNTNLSASIVTANNTNKNTKNIISIAPRTATEDKTENNLQPALVLNDKALSNTVRKANKTARVERKGVSNASIIDKQLTSPLAITNNVDKKVTVADVIEPIQGSQKENSIASTDNKENTDLPISLGRGDIIFQANNVLENILINRVLVSTNKLNNKTTKIHIPNVQQAKWAVEVAASPDYNKRVVSSSNSAAYVHLKDTTQSIRGGYTVGINVSRKIGSNFKIKAGIQYKQVNERFRYVKEGEVKNITVVSNRSYTGDNGEILFKYDTSIYQQIGYTIKTVQNTYKSVEIPIIASFEKTYNKWGLSLDGGLIASFITHYEGETFDASNNIIPLSAQKANGFFVSKPALNISLGASVSYNLKNNLDFFLSPYCRYGLTDNSVSSIGYSQRFNGAGVFVGLRYKLASASNKY